MMKPGSHGDLDDENYGDEPVDGGAERRPPPCVGNIVAALLPEVFETMACVAEDEEPGRSGDARGCKQDERASDSALDGDHLGSAGLIDRYMLLIHPLTLGSGTRLFDGPAPLTEFDLSGSVTTPKGVIIAHYTRR
jgi:hypothetical protein